MNTTYFAVIDADGNVQSAGMWHDHDGIHEALAKMGAVAIDPAHGDQIAMEPWLWRYENGELVPRGPDTAALAATARQHRDDALNRVEWTKNPEVPFTPAREAEWKAYRQALRDISTQPGFPVTVTWPIKPT